MIMEITPLKVELTPLNGKLWTVQNTVEHRRRFSPQTSSTPVYAEITLRTEPYSGPEAFVFVDALAADNEIPYVYRYRVWDHFREPEEIAFVHACIVGVIEGITLALRHLAEEGRPMTSLMVTLVELIIHPISSSPDVCRIVAAGVLRECVLRSSLVEVSLMPNSPQSN